MIVKMVATTICGTDLHILKGDVPEVEVGRILGHEGIGVITEVGRRRHPTGRRRPGHPGVRQFMRAMLRTVARASTATASTRRAWRVSGGSSAT